MTRAWQTLGAVAPTELVDARLQLHHAAQVVASVGVAFLEPRPDDSHPNLGWDERLGALVGHVIPGARAFQAALHPAELALSLLDGAGNPLHQLDLDGRSLDDASAWLAGAIERLGVVLPAAGLTRPPYDLPDHAIARGAPFTRKPEEAFEELARWYANAQSALADLAARSEGRPEVRCWPHHLDLALLEVVATSADGGAAKTIGVGLSPGDASYAEPYWYVSPWPYPERTALSELRAGGHWHTQGFTAAVSTGSALLEGGRHDQPERVRGFLDAAVAACRDALAAR